MYLALGVSRDGTKDVLGLWIEQTEGAKFWLRVMTELKSRGVEDILIALDRWAHRLSGRDSCGVSADARSTRASCISCGAAWPLCRYEGPEASRRRAARDLPRRDDAAAVQALTDFAERPDGQHYPTDRAALAAALGVRDARVCVPPAMRRLLYTTNAIESLHMQLRKIIKTRGHFPNDEAATKLLYLALRNIHQAGAAPG